MSKEINEYEKKAVEVINIVNGLSQTQINYIFNLVNYSVSQSPIAIDFKSENVSIIKGSRTMST